MFQSPPTSFVSHTPMLSFPQTWDLQVLHVHQFLLSDGTLQGHLFQIRKNLPETPQTPQETVGTLG